jgi:hypothetical protein
VVAESGQPKEPRSRVKGGDLGSFKWQSRFAGTDKTTTPEPECRSDSADLVAAVLSTRFRALARSPRIR